MNNIPDAVSEVGAVLGILGIIGAVYSFLKYTNYKATVSMQNDSIRALQENNGIIKQELESSKLDHKRATESIIALEKQVQTYKDLQLDIIAQALKDLASSSAAQALSNQRILDTLKTSAVIAHDNAADGGLLVKTKE